MARIRLRAGARRAVDPVRRLRRRRLSGEAAPRYRRPRAARRAERPAPHSRAVVSPPQWLNWQYRARALGLRQRTIAALLGASEQWVSREIRRPQPRARLMAVIVAWEIMTPAQRGAWLFRTGNGRLAFRQRIVTPGEDEVRSPGWGTNRDDRPNPSRRLPRDAGDIAG